MAEDKEKLNLAERPATEYGPKTAEAGLPSVENLPASPEFPGRESAESGGSMSETGDNRIAAEAAYVPLPTSQSPAEARYRQIESILEEDLADFYFKMDPKTQLQFKVEGENTTRAINQLVSSARIKAKKIVDLIRNWLKIIPGVNKYFLEQEAKIKTDKILALIDKNNQKVF